MWHFPELVIKDFLRVLLFLPLLHWSIASVNQMCMYIVTTVQIYPYIYTYNAFTTMYSRDHITNEEVKARIGNAIGPYEDLMTTVNRRKLKWYGHVTRSSGLAKTILQGTVEGGR